MKSPLDFLGKIGGMGLLGMMSGQGGAGGMGLMHMMGGGQGGGFNPMGVMQMLSQKKNAMPGAEGGVFDLKNALLANQQMAVNPGLKALLRSRGIKIGGLLDG